MKKRTRLFLILTSTVLVLGLGTGLVASFVGFQNFAILRSDGPDELAYVPKSAQLLAFANVADVANSELRRKFRQMQPSGDQPENELRDHLGINIETDIDYVVASASGAGATPMQHNPLLLARGRFDVVRIEGLVREHGGVAEDYKGTRLVTRAGEDFAVAFLEPGLVAVGTSAAVRSAVDTKAAKVGSIRENADVMRLLRDVQSGNAWAVGRLDAVAGSHLPAEVVSRLPPITWFSASGQVDGGLEALVRVETRDDAAAANLRQVIQGFIALARMQVGQRAEFATVVDSLQLGGEGKTVSLGFSVPPELVDALGALHAQRSNRTPGERDLVAPPAPDAPAPPAPSAPSL